MSFEAVCRLCLSTEGTMQPIFSPQNENLPTQIFECTTVEVKNLAGLPGFICEICKSELIIWLKFRRQCLRSNELLKGKFPQLFEPPPSDKPTTKQKEDESCCATTTNQEEVEYYQPDKDELIIEIQQHDEESQEITELEVDAEEETSSTQNLLKGDDEPEYNNEYEEVLEEFEDEQQETISIEIQNNVTLDGGSEHSDDAVSERTLIEETEPNTRDHSQSYKVITPDNRTRYRSMCPVCGKDQQNLKQHMLIHLDVRPFKCNYCDKRFRQRSNFQRHLNIHTGKKPYKCTETDCGVAFADPASLRAHMVRHTGSRDYHCDVCGKFFGHSHVLAAHKRIHTQDRRHECTSCKKRFLSGHALKKHIRTHTGERPFQCKLCPKSFATSGNLRTHQRVHSKERPFECPVCEMKFSYRCVLKTHMRTHPEADMEIYSLPGNGGEEDEETEIIHGTEDMDDEQSEHVVKSEYV